MKTRVIILGVSRYSFPDQKTGQIIEGTKVNYVEQSRTDDENVVGHTPQTANLPYRDFDSLAFNPVPGIYDCTLKVDMSSRKLGVKVSGFQYIAPLSFEEKSAAATTK